MKLINKIIYYIFIILLFPLIIPVWFILALINDFDDSSDNYYGNFK